MCAVLRLQVLHYRVECMEEKLRYLRSIGMKAEQMAVVLQRLPQLLSLDIRNNLVPKYNYLQAELGGSVQTVASYPAYFSLSLPLRCAPALLTAFPRFAETLSCDCCWLPVIITQLSSRVCGLSEHLLNISVGIRQP